MPDLDLEDEDGVVEEALLVLVVEIRELEAGHLQGPGLPACAAAPACARSSASPRAAERR